jgi:hypothetical protein
MARYRVVYTIPSPSGGQANGVSFVDAETMQAAIVKVMLEHEEIAILSAAIDARDPRPLTPAHSDVAIDALAKALVRCNSVLLALLDNPIFAGSLTPERLASLKTVTTDAKLALDLAGVTTTVQR